MNIALLVICLLELNVITLLARSAYAKSRSRDIWRKRYEQLSEEHSDAVYKNRALIKALRENEKKYAKAEKNSAYEVFLYNIVRNIPFGSIERMWRRNDDKL